MTKNDNNEERKKVRAQKGLFDNREFLMSSAYK